MAFIGRIEIICFRLSGQIDILVWTQSKTLRLSRCSRELSFYGLAVPAVLEVWAHSVSARSF